MKVVAERTTCKELCAGDLFSTAGPTYWENLDPGALREKVYIRTEASCPKDEENREVYRISIDLEKWLI